MRSPWVRITFRAHEKDSWAELNLPALEVISGLIECASLQENGGDLAVPNFYANGDGIQLTFKRIPKAVP